MQLSSLPKTTVRPSKRVGRGYGSGKGGHTSSRGQKGQRSRGSIPIWFEGGQLPQIRRFPFIKGKNRFKSLNTKPVVISLTQLNKFPKDTEVTVKTLIEHKLIKEKELKNRSIKVLGTGKLDRALTVSLPTSQAAKEKIEAAGGSVKLA